LQFSLTDTIFNAETFADPATELKGPYMIYMSKRKTYEYHM